MNDKNIHSIDLTPEETISISEGRIVWEKSKADVWDELGNKISDKPKGKWTILFPKIVQWGAAAVLFVLVGLLGVVSNYTKTVECLPGEHLLVELPGGSKVDLNAGSTLSYYPLKWKLEREIKFEGEAYFNVQKGRPFIVESGNGFTQVFGTSFNIYARDDKYRVTCLTGKVKVKSRNDETALLLPNNHVELEEGKLILKKMFEAEKAVAWKNNQFFFAGRPLKEVIDEIERQYAVTIKLQPKLNNRNFGSNFSKKHSVEDVLDYVCKPMNLKFVKESEILYFVVEGS